MLQVDIAVPAADVKRLNDRLDSYVAFHKGNTTKALERVAVKIALAFRASTKGVREGIKKRPVVANPLYANNRAKDKNGLTKRDRMKEHISDWYTEVLKRPDKDKVSFSDKSLSFHAKKAVYRIRKGKRIFMPVLDNAKGAAKNSPLRLMHKRGLADKSWFWMLGRLGKFTKDPGGLIAAKGQVVEVHKTYAERFSEILLMNKLPYARLALKEDKNTIMLRADKMLWYEMLDATQKANVKAGTLGYSG